jgi:competence protein ComEC
VFDAGFQLSFLATAGLIWVSPTVGRNLSWVPETIGIRDSLASTLSATALTLPIMLCNFKQLSIIAPIVNMMILPIIPTVMAIGAIIIIVAAISATLSQMVGWFGWLGLSYILGVTHWLGNIPYAAIVISRTSMVWLMGGYIGILGGLLLRQWYFKKVNNAT